jgi:pimeloyl-ACP methyl ester carboxylesterase
MWLGGWVWRDVADVLRADGHLVYPVTLTGLGERQHLGGPHITLDTQITDVVNLLRFENLQDVLLVGHSFAANVITGAAEQAAERIARLVYVDTWPLPEGVAQHDLGVPGGQEGLEWVKVNGEGWRLPMPTWEAMDEGNELRDLGDAERDFLRERATPQPYNTITQPMHYPKRAWVGLPRTLIWTSLTIAEVEGMVEAYPQVGSTLKEPGWDVCELPTGHWPMVSRSRELAALFMELA